MTENNNFIFIFLSRLRFQNNESHKPPRLRRHRKFRLAIKSFPPPPAVLSCPRPSEHGGADL